MTGRDLPTGLDRRDSGAIRARFDCHGCTQHPTGGKHWKQFPARGGIRAAQQWRREQMVAVGAGRYVAPRGGAVTFGEYAAERVAAWRRHRASTRQQVDSHMRNWILPTFGAVPIGKIRPAHVEAWVVATEPHLAASTVAVVYTWLHRVLADAVRDGLIVSNPADGVELPTIERREVVPLPLDAVDALVDVMPPHLRAVVLTAAWSGLRQGEVLGLRQQRLSLLGSRDARGRVAPPSIYVAEQLQTLDGPPQLAPTKTKRSVRRVPIPAVLVGGLAAHLAEHPVGDDGFVFVNSAGRPWRRNAFGEQWRRAVKRAELPQGTTFHSLRHGYASLLIEAGESVTVVAKRLGHSSPVETLQTYAHLWADSDEHTVSVLDAAHARHVAAGVPGVSRDGSVSAFPQVSG